MGDDDKYKKNFSENLIFFMNLRGKTQTDIITDLGINKSVISSWCNGTRLPRMNKLELIANYLDVPFWRLIEDKSKQNTTDENQLFSILSKKISCLNELGQKKVLDTVNDLLQINKYVQKNESEQAPEKNNL